MRNRNSSSILEGLNRVDEAKRFDVKEMSQFVGNILSNLLELKNVVVTDATTEKCAFYITATFESTSELMKEEKDRISAVVFREVIGAFYIPNSNEGSDFGVKTLGGTKTDKGFIYTVEVYN